MDTQHLSSQLPKHLRRYIVDQDYSRYTPIDQACWRYIMRRLTHFLSHAAHPCYLDGLKKTGIEVDRIPDINKMNSCLRQFDWQALPVSGFIPPAAFMELQSLGFLPIASDMRSVDHILYTPAPDIVHEAAGHAPILVDPNFSAYLKQYAQVARKAIISSEDIELYEAIRNLSDLKENPNATPSEIANAQSHLNAVASKMTHVSEAGYLSRMNWWTAEYGLIGDLQNPKIFGAGLLSSVGESASCLESKVKKIPLTIDCINYSYDITEPQPQLFVTPDFETLGKVLEELASQMAFRVGGLSGLQKALAAKTVNTAEYDTGIQISGVLTKIYSRPNLSQPDYLSFKGPCSLSYKNKILRGHGLDRHPEGFGSPVGKIPNLESFKVGEKKKIQFESGICVEGEIKEIFRAEGKTLLITFKNCQVNKGSEMLFHPAWGEYDMTVGEKITSVFGGPADRESFDVEKDFPVKIIPRKKYSPQELQLQSLYARVREIREKHLLVPDELQDILSSLQQLFPNEWLLVLEIYELSLTLNHKELQNLALKELEQIAKNLPEKQNQIRSGIKIAQNEKAH